MFGKNPVAKSEVSGDGFSLRVVTGSPFYTIQGEGPFSGEPAVFLRLHGCPLRCFFCDTEFSHPDDPTMNMRVVAARIITAAPVWCNLLVITGGEPVRQNLAPLINEMLRQQWRVQIETSGILWQDCLSRTGVTVVVSPKTPRIDEQVVMNARAFKYVVQAGGYDPHDGLPLTNTQFEGGKPQRLARPWDYPAEGRKHATQIFLSPMDEQDETKNAANRAEVARVAMKYGYIAGLQVHKFLNLP